MYKYMLVPVFAAIALVAMAAAHFMSASAEISGPYLIVRFREAGLGNNQTILYRADASADALYACVNGGSKNPSAANKQSVVADVSAQGTFTSGKNGSLRGQLVLSPPASTLSCPPGQNLVLASVEYSDVSVTDTYNGITQPIDGVYSNTFFTF